MTMLLVSVAALAVFAFVVGAVAFLVLRSRSKKADSFDDDFAAGTPPAPVASVEPASVEPASVEPARAVEAAPVEPPAAFEPAVEPAPVASPAAFEPAVDVAPVEPPHVAEPAPVASPAVEVAPAPAVEPAPAAFEPAEPTADTAEAGGPVQIEKLRIAELGLVLRVWGLQLGGEDLLAFATEGFAARGREELVLYVRRATCADGDVVRSLKRFAGLALIVMERVEPVKLGELLKVPGEVGTVPLGGYLVVEPTEPDAVPFGARFVLIGLPRRLMAGDVAAVRASVAAETAAAPWLTAL